MAGAPWNPNPGWTSLGAINPSQYTSVEGLFASAFNRVMDNMQYLYNHLGRADFTIKQISTNFIYPGQTLTISTIDGNKTISYPGDILIFVREEEHEAGEHGILMYWYFVLPIPKLESEVTGTESFVVPNGQIPNNEVTITPTYSANGATFAFKFKLGAVEGPIGPIGPIGPPGPSVSSGLKVITINAQDWSGTSGNYTRTILPTEHGMGATSNLVVFLQPFVDGSTTQFNQSYDSPVISTSGVITITSERNWSGVILIAGGMASQSEIKVKIPPITLEYMSGRLSATEPDEEGNWHYTPFRQIVCFARCEKSFVDFLEKGGRCQLWLFGLFRNSSARKTYDAESDSHYYEYKKNTSKWIHPRDNTPIAPPKLFTAEQWNYGNKNMPEQGGWGIALVGNGSGYAAKPDISHSTTNGFIPTEFEITKDDLITLLDGSLGIRKIIPFKYFEDNLVYRYKTHPFWASQGLINIREGALLFCRKKTRNTGFYHRSGQLSIIQNMKAELVINDEGVKRNGICTNIIQFSIGAEPQQASQKLGCKVID